MASQIPTVIASECGHGLTGDFITPGSACVKAVTITHCAFCRPLKASVCCHELLGLLDSVDKSDVSRIPKLCEDCIYFQELCKTIEHDFSCWNEHYSSPDKPKLLAPEYRKWRKKPSELRDAYMRGRVAYEKFVKIHSKIDDPAFPTVNDSGVPLIQSDTKKERRPIAPPEATPTVKRVTFDEAIDHPEGKTAKGKRTFQRHTRNYKPGKWAAPDEKEWLNTSKPQLYGLKGLPKVEESAVPGVDQDAPAVDEEPNTITLRSWRKDTEDKIILYRDMLPSIPKETSLHRQVVDRASYLASIQGIGCLLTDQERKAFVPRAFVSGTDESRREDDSVDALTLLPSTSAPSMNGDTIQEVEAANDSEDEEEFHEASESLHLEMLQRRRGSDDDDWTLGDSNIEIEDDVDGEVEAIDEVDADDAFRDRTFSSVDVLRAPETSAAASDKATSDQEQSWTMPVSEK